MNPLPKVTVWTVLAFLTVLGCAAAARGWYVAMCADQGRLDPALMVQGPMGGSQIPPGTTFRSRTPATELDNLVANVVEHHWFGCWTPLADTEELTAHEAPLYPLLFGAVAMASDSADMTMRWIQCVLGSLTASCYFLFARRAFHNTVVAFVAGLLAAFYPFWIVNTAELNDGVLATFFLAVALTLGARAGQTGGGFTGLAFGIALAAVAMTRAALLPFAAVALLWFLWECRRFPLGWFAGFLALIGFVNGLAPWAIRNFQVFERPVPIATTTYLHLWVGNNSHATGAPMGEAVLRLSLPADRVKELRDDTNQATRYNPLATEVWHEVKTHPAETISRRFQASQAFLLGAHWSQSRRVSVTLEKGEKIAGCPEWLLEHIETILQATLLVLFFLAFLGWRSSYPWRRYGRIAAVALIMTPLPYVLSHADWLSGPRLPLDGVLLCFAAFAFVSLIPGLTETPGAAKKKTEAE